MSTTFNLFATKHTSYDNRKTFKKETELVFDLSFTSNYLPIARACGVDKALFDRSHGYSEAFEAIPSLIEGIKRLKLKPQHFKDLEPTNGWGTYCDFLESCIKTLEACEKFPEASIFYS